MYPRTAALPVWRCWRKCWWKMLYVPSCPKSLGSHLLKTKPVPPAGKVTATPALQRSAPEVEDLLSISSARHLFRPQQRMNLTHVPKKITFMAWDIHPLHRDGTGELPRCLRLAGGDVLAMLDFWLPSSLRAQPVQAGRIPASHHLSPSLQAGLLSAREMGT